MLQGEYHGRLPMGHVVTNPVADRHEVPTVLLAGKNLACRNPIELVLQYKEESSA